MKLSARESDICKEIVLGKSNTEIAEALGMSAHTVKWYICMILNKTETKNRAHLAYMLGKNNII